MSKRDLAIALCRVSSHEQLENNSLNRQREAVLKAAEDLGLTIPDEYWWSGSVSSKRGANLKRKDLQEAIEACKKNQRIGYVIVDEPDRFMRSIDEAAFFEVTFRQMGVIVWYASDPELNKGDLASKLLKFTKYLAAEGSNEERQRKSISGQVKALKEGLYPFAPKPGYKKGSLRALQEIHPTRGPELQKILVRLANKVVTPSRALVELNDSKFMDGHAPYKMDKFRKIVTDPFYAGVVEMDKQVKYRNEHGLHEPLITLAQHYALLEIMDNKKKNQAGPRKNGNPDFPCNNIVSCDRCTDKKNGRVVGFKHTNGKPSSKVYERYRCRGCGLYLTKDELHAEIKRLFSQHKLDPDMTSELQSALNIVWKQKEGDNHREINRLAYERKMLHQRIANHVSAISDPENALIKAELRSAITTAKDEIAGLDDKINELSQLKRQDKENFTRFAFSFIHSLDDRFLNLSPENRLRCKQLFFPGGFRLDKNKKVYTPEISPLITLATNKKGTKVPSNSHLVQLNRIYLNFLKRSLMKVCQIS